MNENADLRRKRRTRQGSNSVKLADVARLAGVSTGSVSRALNEPHKVSAKLRSAVLKAVEELDWVPHAGGRALASLRSRTVGAIIPTLANPNFANEMNAVQRRLIEAGYILLIGCSEYDPDKALMQTRSMIERGIDGLILVGENYSEGLWRLLAKQALPYVITYGLRPGSPHPSVGVDNYQAFVRLTNFVLDQGHRRVAMIAQRTENNDRAEARLRGTLDALTARGIRIPEGQLVEKEWSVAEGRVALREIMSVLPPPTVVICANDFLAVGAVLESQSLGIEVPRDLSVVGFDDVEIAAHLSPPLTTMRVPMYRLGELTADHLIAKLRGAPVAHAVEVDAELIVRGTVGPPRAP